MKKIKDKHSQIEIQNITPREGHYFFGFYDVTPWSHEENYLLAHRSNFINRMPEESDSVDIGFVNLDTGEFNKIGETMAWNFQQGARLQWHPKENKIFYNIQKEESFGAKVYSINSKEEKEFKNSIYTLSPKGDFGLTLNYSRLHRLGGYGYSSFEDKYKNNPSPEDDGIFKVSLKTGDRDLILPINKVAKFNNPSFSKIKTHHYLTHPTFNHSGNKFCFLHRFTLDDGGVYTRLLTSDINGDNLNLIAEGTLSHFDWFNDKNILIWGRSKSYLTKARKHKFFNLPVFNPLLNFLRGQIRGFLRHKVIGDQYLLFDIEASKSQSVGVDLLTEDGHPTRFQDTPWLITDTYPDKNHYRSLILYNLENNNKIDLARFYSIPNKNYISGYSGNTPWDLSGMRSDLHPRWNRDGTKVCIDSVHEGKKDIFIVDLSGIIHE